MECEDCGKRGTVTRSNVTGNVYRCLECDGKKEKEMGIEREKDFKNMCPYGKAFESYILKDGPLSDVTDKGRIEVKTKAQEEQILAAMGVHYAEKGEKSGGFDFLGKSRRIEDIREEINDRRNERKRRRDRGLAHAIERRNKAKYELIRESRERS